MPVELFAYLPARNELSVIYTNKSAIGNFNSGLQFYWSSSEAGTNIDAWRQAFNDGYQYTKTKSSSYNVRCARK